MGDRDDYFYEKESSRLGSAGLVYLGRFGQPEKRDGAKDASTGPKSNGSRYINKLVATSRRRELEREIFYERKVKRETLNSAEGTEAPKEVFVTSGYKAKLKERQEIEHKILEEEKKAEADDVRRKTNMTDFHRRLLTQAVASRSLEPSGSRDLDKQSHQRRRDDDHGHETGERKQTVNKDKRGRSPTREHGGRRGDRLKRDRSYESDSGGRKRKREFSESR